MNQKDIENLENIFKNMNEDEKHQYILNEYDRLIENKTPLPDNKQQMSEFSYNKKNYTPYKSYVPYNEKNTYFEAPLKKEYGYNYKDNINQYNQKYNNVNEAWEGLKSWNSDDYKDYIVNDGKLIGETVIDKLTDGEYRNINKYLGGNYEERYNNYFNNAEYNGLGDVARISDKVMDELAKVIRFKGIKKIFR